MRTCKHDKEDVNCDNTNTFHITIHGTIFFVARLFFDVTSLFAIRSWDPNPCMGTVSSRSCHDKSKRRHIDRVEECVVLPRDVQRSCRRRRASAV